MKHYLGIDLGGTDIKAGVVREDYTVAVRHSIPTLPERSAIEVIADMAAAGKAALEMAGLSEADVTYVGIGVPGMIDCNTRHIINANNLDWKDVDLIGIFRDLWEIPVLLANDADVAALAEVLAGAAKGYDDAIMLTLGTGIGGGLVFNRQVYTGGDGYGTEPGHIIIVAGGEQCTCGLRGCFEAYASVTGLIRDTIRAMAESPDSIMCKLCDGDVSRVDGRTPFEAAKLGDAAGKRVVDSYIGYLATGIVSIINLLRPQAIIVGGGVSNAGDALFIPLREAVASSTWDPDVTGVTPVLRAALGNDAGMIGAALLGA